MSESTEPLVESDELPLPLADEQAPKISLRPLWYWLTLVNCVSFFTTPADPESMLMPMVCGLLTFSSGVIFGSSAHVKVRAAGIVASGIGMGWWLVSAPPHEVVMIPGRFLYGMLSFALGLWASRRIEYGRYRILRAFCTGYVIGGVLCCFWGNIVGSVVLALNARSEVRIKHSIDSLLR